MIHGIWINDKNTLDDFGLILLADVSIGAPEPKTKYIPVPEADGEMDFTGALTGGVVRYGMRQISLQLFPAYDIIAGKRRPATEQHAAMIRQRLMEEVHGQKVMLWLPDDGGHYFRGRMTVGEKGGYNNTTIPITMTAEPWRYKNLVTTVRVTEDGAVTLANETRRAVPTFTATDAVATVTFGDASHQLTPGNHQFPDIVLEPGQNVLTFSNVGDPVVVTYQEAVL